VVPAGVSDRTRPAPSRGLPLPVLALTKSTGGLASYHRTLVQGLSPAEFAIHTICLSDNAAAFAADLAALGHSAESLEMARYRIDPLGDLRVAGRVARVARARGVRVILAHGAKAGVIARAVGALLRVPVVECQASLPFLPRVQGRRARVYRLLLRAARVLGGHVVALSESARHESLAAGIVAADRITVIRSGIDTARFAPAGRRVAMRHALGVPPDAPLLLWLGRLERQKAPEVFLDLAERLTARLPKLQVVIAGSGSLGQGLADRIAASPARGRLRLLPWQADPAALLEAGDVLCLSSRWEGLPLSLLEAMAMGLVPVATAVDGVVEVIEDGISGRLVPPGDPAALEAALAEVLSDPPRRAELAAGAVQRVAQAFTARRMLDDWRRTLQALASGRAPGCG